MKLRHRYLEPFLEKDLRRKMVFIGGPRQVGKTTLALRFLPGGSVRHSGYLTWDDLSSREMLQKGLLPSNERTVVLDEIHKFPHWRSLVKGFFDKNKGFRRFVVTGSARLDYYRKGGDSLMGRYHYYRLHPFSLLELNAKPSAEDLDSLLRFGGFPEPLLRGKEDESRRWQRERRSRVVQTDLRDLEQVREIALVELLMGALPVRVGAPLSLKGLSEDLQVAHDTVQRWLEILERLYFSFRIAPFGAPRIRAVKKEQKLYLWDWSEVPEAGIRFENLVASQLLKYCHFKEDIQGHAMELRFLRDTDKREVDFVVLQAGKPLFAVECKTGERNISTAVRYFMERTTIPKFFQVHLGTRDVEDPSGRLRLLPFRTFCLEMEMP